MEVTPQGLLSAFLGYLSFLLIIYLQRMTQQLLTGQMLLCAPQPGLAAGEKLGAALKALPLQCAGQGCQELWG